MKNNLPNLLVSVIMITYNHEKYITEAIEGVLNQLCYFQVELIIADDKSPDGTESVVNKIIKNHRNGNWVKYTKHDINKGMIQNFTWALQQAEGDYIAICEGDDYWTDPYKLQKQVDFLEKNPDFILCFTNCRTVNKAGKITNESAFDRKPNSTLTKFDLPINAPTLTRVFRNKSIQDIKFPNITALDAYLLIWQAQFGKIGYIDEVTAVYRKHPSGIWSSKNKKEKGKYFVELRLSAFDIIGPELYPQFYVHSLNAILKLKKIDKITANHYLLKLREIYLNHHLKTRNKLVLDLCFNLIRFNPKSQNLWTKKVINKLLKLI